MTLTEEQSHQEALYYYPYHYDDLVKGIYKYSNIQYLYRLEMIKNLLRPFEGQYVLDAGCGDGRLCYELKKENLKVVGADMSERAIAFARAFNPDLEFYVQDLENLKIPHSFDYIVLMETLEHLIPEKIGIVLDNISKHLKENGKLIITVPSVNRRLDPKHYQHFTAASLTETVSSHFRVKEIFGYDLVGYNRGIFDNLNRLGLLLHPFSYRIRSINRYYSFLYNLYAKKIGTGDPELCSGIVAVCDKH